MLCWLVPAHLILAISGAQDFVTFCALCDSYIELFAGTWGQLMTGKQIGSKAAVAPAHLAEITQAQTASQVLKGPAVPFHDHICLRSLLVLSCVQSQPSSFEAQASTAQHNT